MMASIPNMRSTPLAIPSTPPASATDGASGGFAVPARPDQAQAPATPGQPCLVAPPVLAPTPVEPLDGIAPQVVEPEGTEAGDAGEGEGTAPAKAETKDDKETQPAIVIPFIQQQMPAIPQVRPAAGTDTPQAETIGAAPVRRPGAAAKNDTPVSDVPDAPEADGTDVLHAAVKVLLQRKPLPTKQVAAAPEPVAADTAKADPAPEMGPSKQVAAPVAPAPIQTAGPLPANEAPQPAFSSNAAQPMPAAAEKATTVDGVRTSDLAVERKLDLARDGAWLDRLARDIARSASDDSPLRFRLHPQTLGSLQVELQQGDRGTAMRLTVETEAARQILTDAQPRLTAEARAQGVRIAETHVDLSGSGRHAPGDQRRQDDARQTPLIRTVPGMGNEAASARMSRRARLDRYA
jgi:flagellar hook-length control protein FliK